MLGGVEQALVVGLSASSAHLSNGGPINYLRGAWAPFGTMILLLGLILQSVQYWVVLLNVVIQ